MSRPLVIADAARLALVDDEPPVGQPTTHWLDLRADPAGVATRKLRRVAERLARSLLLDGDQRLVVACGALSAAQAAQRLAEPLAEGAGPGPLVAAVRGESLLDELEHYLIRGATLARDTDGRSLCDERRAPTDAWAAAPAACVRAALAEGAQAVVTRHTPPDEAMAAALADSLGWDPNAGLETAAAACRDAMQRGEPLLDTPTPGPLGLTPVETPVTLAMPSDAVTSAVARLSLNAVTELWQRVDRPDVQLRATPLGNEDSRCLVTLAGTPATRVADAATRLLIAAAPGAFAADAFPTPIVGPEPWNTTLPTSELEFGLDIRTAREWVA